MNTDNTAGSAAPAGPSDVVRADEWLLKVHAHLQEALRIPTMPWPDPGAHGHEATARAIHASYCALRFKVIDAIAELTATRVAITGLLADRATRGAAGAEGMVPRAVLIEQTAPGEAEDSRMLDWLEKNVPKIGRHERGFNIVQAGLSGAYKVQFGATLRAAIQSAMKGDSNAR